MPVIDAIQKRMPDMPVLTADEVGAIDRVGRAMIDANEGNALLENALVQFVRCARVLQGELKKAEG